MKNNRKAVEERQSQILNLVRERGGISVEEIAHGFGISLMTVRRDLQTLEDQRKLKRTHGGAVPFGKNAGTDPDFGDVAFCRAKLSEYAARFVEDGDVIFINGSRTALDMLEYVDGKHVTVYTNNGRAAFPRERHDPYHRWRSPEQHHDRRICGPEPLKYYCEQGLPRLRRGL